MAVTVRKGETLWAIAARELGNGARWPEIAALNNVGDPRKLRPGTVLQMPGEQTAQKPRQPEPPPRPRMRPPMGVAGAYGDQAPPEPTTAEPAVAGSSAPPSALDEFRAGYKAGPEEIAAIRQRAMGGRQPPPPSGVYPETGWETGDWVDQSKIAKRMRERGKSGPGGTDASPWARLWTPPEPYQGWPTPPPGQPSSDMPQSAADAATAPPAGDLPWNQRLASMFIGQQTPNQIADWRRLGQLFGLLTPWQ